MMRFPVPQFIGVEDKIAGPLTWKQLYWMIAMTAILLLMWKAFTLPVFIAAGGLTAVIFMAFAFYKPWGQPLTRMVWHATIFIFRPKLYMWQRIPGQKVIGGDKPMPTTTSKEDPKKTLRLVKNYAEILDNPTKNITQESSSETKKSNHGILSLFSKKEK